jgi:hypothetical protein
MTHFPVHRRKYNGMSIDIIDRHHWPWHSDLWNETFIPITVAAQYRNYTGLSQAPALEKYHAM